MNKKINSEPLHDLIPFASLMVSKENIIKEVNTYINDILCDSRNKALIGKSIFEIVKPNEQPDFRIFLNKISQSIGQMQWELFHLISDNGSENRFLMNGSYHLHNHHDGNSYLLVGVPCTYSDCTNNNYEVLFKHAPFGIAFLDENGFFEEANAMFIDHIDGTGNLNLKKHSSGLLNDQAYEKLKQLASVLEKNQQPYVKDLISFPGSGVPHRIIEVTLSKIINPIDHKERTLLFTEDATNRQDTHNALLQSEKLALTGRLAASLAHEINNPLQTSLGCLGLVEEMLDEDDDELEVYINLAIDELQRSARIVKKLRDLNRSTDTSERIPVDLRDIIEGVLVLTKNQLHDRNIVPVFPYQGPPPIISVSKDQIQQVILNLVMNAIDELPDGGNIYLDIILSEDPKGVTVKIRDTGNGIDPDIANHIFDPFFSTKADGIGLGLYICKQIIENHNGSLKYECESGKGTEFSIWIPDDAPHQKKDK